MDWRRWSKRLVIAVGTLLLLAIAFVSWAVWRNGQRLADALAATTASDPAWTLEAIEATRPAVPDDENGWLYLQQVGNASSGLGKASPCQVWLHPAFQNVPELPERLTPAMRAVLELAFTGEEQRRAAVRRLGDFTHARSAGVWTDWATSTSVPTNALRLAREYLRYDLLDSLNRGDREAALEVWRASFQAQRLLDDLPTLRSSLLRQHLMAVAQLERLLALQDWQDHHLAAIAAELDAAVCERPLIAAVRGQRAADDAAWEFYTTHPERLPPIPRDYPKSQWWAEQRDRWRDRLPGIQSSDRTETLLLYNELLALVEGPELGQRSRIEAWWKRVNQRPVRVAAIGPVVRMVDHALRRERSMLHCARLAVAAERYQLRHGRFPAALADLVTAGLIDAVPLDPFDDRPLKLAHRHGIWLAYSAGPDGIDDGGYRLDFWGLEAGTDIGVRLWEPNLRGQAPAVDPPLAATTP